MYGLQHKDIMTGHFSFGFQREIAKCDNNVKGMWTFSGPQCASLFCMEIRIPLTPILTCNCIILAGYLYIWAIQEKGSAQLDKAFDFITYWQSANKTDMPGLLSHIVFNSPHKHLMSTCILN